MIELRRPSTRPGPGRFDIVAVYDMELDTSLGGRVEVKLIMTVGLLGSLVMMVTAGGSDGERESRRSVACESSLVVVVSTLLLMSCIIGGSMTCLHSSGKATV